MCKPILFLALILASFRSFPCHAVDQPRVQGALARYVAKQDESFEWKIRRMGTFKNSSYTELSLTSQTWRNIIWRHQLFIIRPSTANAKNSHAMLVIAGGRWRKELEDPPGEKTLPGSAAIFVTAAEKIGHPVAVLLQVPYQPILEGRFEDEAIAHTFEQYMRSGDDTWPLLLPMVKSAVRAIDAIQQYAGQSWSLPIKTFTVTGASKRGWTTWLTGAIDSRVTALAPMVIDMLNMKEQMEHQVTVWGKPSEQIQDYTKRGLHRQLDSAQGKQLRDIVDPFSYRTFLSQPKLMILGTNDAYWPVDAVNLYWNELKGENYVVYIPNQGHGIFDIQRIVGGLHALNCHAIGSQSLPKLSWKFNIHENNVTVQIQSDQEPALVRTWIAKQPQRDFRNARWKSYPCEVADNLYTHQFPVDHDAFQAVFAEVKYKRLPIPLFLSSTVKVIPPRHHQAGQ